MPFCRLKPSIDFQFMVNAKGSSPAEILGTTYKTSLKPALTALANETKRIFVSKQDESVDLQKQLQGIAKMLEEKRSHVSVLQANNNEVSHLIVLLYRICSANCYLFSPALGCARLRNGRTFCFCPSHVCYRIMDGVAHKERIRRSSRYKALRDRRQSCRWARW
jgi:hypothetical protein